MDFNIDFRTIPDIDSKISEKEIDNLNRIFQSPEVIEKLKEIEKFRKKRQKAFWVITLVMIIITILVSYVIGKIAAVATGSFFPILLVGLFFYVGTWDDSFSTIEWLWILATFLYGGTYAAYRSKIEIPLKRDVMSRICKKLHTTFEYSYDGKYSFDDLSKLVEKKFLNSYNRIDKVEDSVELKIELEKKWFILRGFELKTRRVSGSGKNRKNVVTNHDYLMKITFPYARIPITCDLLVIPDKNESKWFLRKLFSFGNKNRVTLEDVEFETLFDAHCEDQVTSRMILTPAFMMKMVDFVKKTGNTYSFLFTNNTVYIKRKIKKKYMEVGTSKNIFKNVQWFLDFYIDMREVMILSKEMHFLYLSQTQDAITEALNTESTPILFQEKKWFRKLLWLSNKKTIA